MENQRGKPAYITEDLMRENLELLLSGGTPPEWAFDLFEESMDRLEAEDRPASD
jgi:hypothetical protein